MGFLSAGLFYGMISSFLRILSQSNSIEITTNPEK